jgi:hypothetical protein
MAQWVLRKIAGHFGRVLIDIGKLVIASFVLGSLIKGERDQSIILLFGSVIGVVTIGGEILLLSIFEE